MTRDPAAEGAQSCAFSGANYNPILSTIDNSYAFYARAQKECPVVHSNELGGFYLLTRYEDVRAAANSWELFSSAGGIGLPARQSAERVPALEMDPPQHGPWRRLYMDAITPAILKRVEPEIGLLANAMIDGFAERGECDLIHEFTEPLPVLVMCKAIGLKVEDPLEISRLAQEFTSAIGDPAKSQAALERLCAVMIDEVYDRRRSPRDDYLTRVAQAELDGKPMSHAQLSLFLTGFLVAGHESTASGLGSLLFHVLSRAELRERVVTDKGSIRAAVEEALRLHAPFQGFSRTTTAETQVAGTTIAQGALVRLCYAAANRDPEAYERPDVFDIDRPKRTPHLSFGYGRHSCAGASLARLEMQIATRELLRRLPDISIVEDLEYNLLGGVLAVPRSLRARFTPAKL